LVEKVFGGTVGEAEIGAVEILVEKRLAEETAELLFFDEIARSGEDVAAAGKNGASDAAVESGEESELAFVEGEFGIAAVKGDLVGGLDGIDGCGINAKGVESIVELVRGFFRTSQDVRDR
jgi:hypothetical protein